LAGLTPARALLLGFAAFAFALAACSKSSGVPSPTPTVSSSLPTPGPSSTPFPATIGVAYIPDGGNGGPPGLTVAHFETVFGQFFHYTLQFVNFGASVRSYHIASDASVAVAVEKGGKNAPAGNYALIQGVLGAGNSNPVPGGPPYDTSVAPTAIPSGPPVTQAVIPDVTSEGVLLTGNAAVGLSMGPAATGILGINQPASQTPTFNGFVGYQCGGKTLSKNNNRANIAVSSLALPTSGVLTVLVRGPDDLVAFSVTPNFNVSPPNYVFCVTAQDTKLGTAGTLQGRGAMAISPTDASRAVIAQSGAVNTNSITLVTGLPISITKGTPVQLSGSPRANSLAIHPAGAFAVVGADKGLYVVSGVSGISLAPVPQGSPAAQGPYSPVYMGADGKNHPLSNISSVGFSADGGYVAVLASLTPSAPGGSTDASLVVLPFNVSSGVLSAPVIVDNGLITPPFFQDTTVIR
jgi:hypothetical protein